MLHRFFCVNQVYQCLKKFDLSFFIVYNLANMFFGFQSSQYNSLTLDQELKFSTQNNIDFFDVFFDGFFPETLSPLSKLSLTAWRKYKPLTVHLPIDFFRLDNVNQQTLIDFIHEYKPAIVTAHFDEALWEDLLRLTEAFSDIPENVRPKLCIENTVNDSHKDYRISYIDFFLKSAKYFSINQFIPAKGKPPLYATIDIGHAKANYYSPVSYINAIIKMGVSIEMLHLHDNDGKSDTHRPAGSIPLSSGGIDFSRILNLCLQNNASPFCVIEHWEKNVESWNYLKNLDTTQ